MFRTVDGQAIDDGDLSALIQDRTRITHDAVQETVGAKHPQRCSIGTVDRSAIDTTSIEPPVTRRIEIQDHALLVERSPQVDRRAARSIERAQFGHRERIVQVDRRVGDVDGALIVIVPNKIERRVVGGNRGVVPPGASQG